jgi:hypothetical protein
VAPELLSRVHQPLGVERALNRLVQLERTRRPLTLELSSLRVADAVLARDRAAETDGELEQVLDSERRTVELCGVVGVN